MFDGFVPGAFDWFAGLERDNSRTYFAATRERYERDVRGALRALLDELSEAFGGEARVFRQQRDLRFTPDKSRYKTRTYGVAQDAALGHVGGTWRAAAPLNAWLDEHVGRSAMPPSRPAGSSRR